MSSIPSAAAISSSSSSSTTRSCNPSSDLTTNMITTTTTTNTTSRSSCSSPSPSSSSSKLPPQPHPLRRRLSRIESTDHLYLRLPSGAIKYVRPRNPIDTGSGSRGSNSVSQTGQQDTSNFAQGSIPDGSRPVKSRQNHKKGAGGGGGRAGDEASHIVSLGKFGTFDAQDLNGVPFGWTWEIGPPKGIEDQSGQDGDLSMEDSSAIPSTVRTTTTATSRGGGEKLKGKRAGGTKSINSSSTPGSLRIMIGPTLSELEETNATNEDIFDDPTSTQRLTVVDVQALKDSGLQGQELIDEMTRASTSFEKRTVWSQDKFIKKKEAKHLKLFTPLPPSIATMAEYHFERSPEKIRGLRIDSLAQMMSFAGVAAGGRFLVVDGTSGLLSAACLDRMGGLGRLLAIHDNDAAPEFDILRCLNFPDHVIDDVLRSLHWAQADEKFQHPFIPPMPDKLDESIKESGPEGIKTFRGRERERQRIGRKYAAREELEDLRQELFDGDFDGVLIACGYEPVSIINALLPYLSGSANIVVHSPLLQPLIEAHSILRSSRELVNLSLTEPWLRRYQVLPGRTHPEMNTSASGGYILHAIRVFTDEMAREEMRKRDQEEEEEVEEEESKRGMVELEMSEGESKGVSQAGDPTLKRGGGEGHIASTEPDMKRVKITNEDKEESGQGR